VSPSTLRSRLAPIGAALAVAVFGGGLIVADAGVSSGTRFVFVPIPPCRLVDTRPDTQVGSRNVPLDPGEVFAIAVTGSSGQCSGIPTDVGALSLNVTVVNPTADGFLTVFPGDVSNPPNASNLNFVAGAPPTPNKVDVKVSPSGTIKVFHNAGTTDLIIDIAGYYEDHNFDDRYALNHQIVDFTALDASSSNMSGDQGGGCVGPLNTANNAEIDLALPLPAGARLNAVKAKVVDNDPLHQFQVSLMKEGFTASGPSRSMVGVRATSGSAEFLTFDVSNAAPVGAGTSYAAIASISANVAPNSTFFCGVIVDYTIDPVLAAAG
jgi:hypothetical protein